MRPATSSLLTVYEGWDGHNLALMRAMMGLTPQHLAFRPAPHLRSVGEIAGHLALGRLSWFYRMSAPGSAELAGHLGAWEGEKLDTEQVVDLQRWMEATSQQEEEIAMNGAELLRWLDTTWHMIQTTLCTWTVADLAQTYRHAYQGKLYAVSRQWTLWRVMSHDIHHGGELAILLGMLGIDLPDLGEQGGHLTELPLAEQSFPACGMSAPLKARLQDVCDRERLMRAITWQQVWGRRLARHALLAPKPQDQLVEVVRAVCGMHAQVMSAAELAIGVRIAGVTRQDVRAELWQRRGLLKTYGLRGTLHLFPADEAPLWVAALRASSLPTEPRWLAQQGLEKEQKEAILAAIREALDGCYLTREELGREVARRAGSWATEAVIPAFGGQWPRWLVLLGAAANAGVLCFGPNLGNQVTFVRPDQWLGGWEVLDGSAALREIFRRYLAAYGPATHREFAQWFGMRPKMALSLTRDLADELEEVEVEGTRAWLLASETQTSWPPAQGVVRLLPHFDPYLIGCHPRDRLVPAAWAKRVLTRGAIGNLPLVLVDGVVAGLWQQRRRGRLLEIQVETFQPLSSDHHQQLEAIARQIGDVMEAESRLALGAVDARPHL